jgi:hypothetical protein
MQMAVAGAYMHFYVYLCISRFCLSGLVESISHTQTIQYDFFNETKNHNPMNHKSKVCGGCLF